MELELFQIDAFSSQPFGGNPAAVCPLSEWLDDSVLQSIASENNLSETAFFVKDSDVYTIRWFTPTSEIDLCGHATLASGYVLLNFISPDLNEIQFSSQSGSLGVARNGNRYTLNFPARPGRPVDCPTALREALGRAPLETYLAKSYVAVFDDADLVREITPDILKFTELDSEGVFVTARGKDCDFVSRCFFPRIGIPEDPVTGAAHCTLVPYWANRFQKNSFFCRQLSARGGELWCELQGERVKISGHCALYLRGNISLKIES